MDYIKKIEENEGLQIKTLQDLVSIRSVVENPVTTRGGEFYPFGRGVQDAFVYTLEKAAEMGFKTRNTDNYGGHIEFGKGDDIVGIICHLDVVSEGDKWSFPPFSGAVSEGYIYGRGVLDDKGPAVAVLFAMKALKDAGYEPRKRIRLILGLDEENFKWDGMKYYAQQEKMPDYGFTPDGVFPALYGEKGIVNFEIARKFERKPSGGLELRSLSGGLAPNIVPEKARAVVKAEDTQVYELIRQSAAEYRERSGYRLNVRGVGKSLEITTEGKPAHGAEPEAGLNAISILTDFLGGLNFSDDDLNVFFDFYNRYIGFDFYGTQMGCGFEDDYSGKLTFNVGKISYDRRAVTLTVNVRYPVTFTEEQVYEAILPIIDRYDLGLIKGTGHRPVFMDPEGTMIRTLTEIYRKHTGDEKSLPQVTGIGTYARASANVVAFGALFPGDPDLMHQKDERLSLERFMTMTRIYADAIYSLSQPEFHLMQEEQTNDQS